jgi:molybdopterin/thiamine biosynthesis adenylyltransferase/rhodanese-related sulfurtransferase/molybdopterin converting factor small subunit
MVKVYIPTPLRRFTDNNDVVEVTSIDVLQAMQALTLLYPNLKTQLFDEQGQLRHFINIFLNDDDIRLHEGVETPVAAGDTLDILPAIAGGMNDALSMSEWREQLEDDIAQLKANEAIFWLAQHPNGVILDVRTRQEWSVGHIANAQHIDRGFLELQIEQLVTSRDTPILIYCASGGRSLFAANTLQTMGYHHVFNLVGGINAWKNAGLAIETPVHLGEKHRARYMRHLSIPEVGEIGQVKLLKSKVLVVGAGGLGCPVALYLAAAGVGTLGIIDHDVVDTTNLQRQILHTEEFIGKSKTDSAKQTLSALNSSIDVRTYNQRLDLESATSLIAQYDVIVDCTDNFDTRYLINDVAAEFEKPVVHGSVYRFDGQVSVFYGKEGPCYRCVYPEAPPAELAPPCADAGVLGVLPGTIGLLQATEAMKLILNIGKPLIGKTIRYDALSSSFRTLSLVKDPQCKSCGNHTIAEQQQAS